MSGTRVRPTVPFAERPTGTAGPGRPDLLLQLGKRRWASGRFPYDPPATVPGDGGLIGNTAGMTAIKIGYARVSTEGQDLTA